MSNNASLSKVGFNNLEGLGEVMEFAQMISKSSMVPKDYVGKAENILVAVMMGAELGLKPFSAMQNIAVINGRPSIWGDAVLALIQAHPECEYIEEEDLALVEKQGSATCTIKRKGHKAVTNTFTVEMAKKANLWGKQGPWSQYSARMLKMRARGFSSRDAFADVLKGISIAEEAQDIPAAERDITPVANKINTLVQQKNNNEQISKKEKQVETVEEVSSTKNDSDLSIVINSIEAAESIESLKNTKQYVNLLADEDEKRQARLAYNVKLKKFNEANGAPENPANNDDWNKNFDEAKTL